MNSPDSISARTSTGGTAAAPGQAAMEDYFARWTAAFERTPAVSEKTYQLAGDPIRLRFMGDSLAPILTSALAHLPAGQPDRPPTLDVLCWDVAATEVRPPEPPWTWPSQWRQGSAFHPFDNPLFQVAVVSNAGDFTVFRADTGQAVFWVRDARALPPAQHGAPMPGLFALWANGRGQMMVHAGCVGTDRGSVLLVGKGGSGKSTTCLLCAEAGLDYLADDYCLVGTNPVPTAYSLYCSGKLLREFLPTFPRLASLAVDPFNDPLAKPVIYVRKDRGFAATHQSPLRAVIVPFVTKGTETTIEPTSAAQALLALAPSSLFHLPNTGNGSFQSLVQLVRVLPCFRLNLGNRFEAIPPTIRSLIARLP